MEEEESVESMFSRFQTLVIGLKVLNKCYTIADCRCLIGLHFGIFWILEGIWMLRKLLIKFHAWNTIGLASCRNCSFSL